MSNRSNVCSDLEIRKAAERDQSAGDLVAHGVTFEIKIIKLSSINMFVFSKS